MENQYLQINNKTQLEKIVELKGKISVQLLAESCGIKYGTLISKMNGKSSKGLTEQQAATVAGYLRGISDIINS